VPVGLARSHKQTVNIHQNPKSKKLPTKKEKKKGNTPSEKNLQHSSKWQKHLLARK
jgi:hypothetical protein